MRKAPPHCTTLAVAACFTALGALTAGLANDDYVAAAAALPGLLAAIALLLQK